MQSGGVVSTAAIRGQVWLTTSGSPWAKAALAGGVALNYIDEGTMWVLAAMG